ncbi:hypothetical protein [Pseudoalteromonas ruthenica]|uniref:hypothetical protein n=1 Tax=Pseudoalteromonas ruthenica TaxID=151081 RepID=UPI0006965495|nr:hypothetical protein [Pseudoalteromonas ruthenica]TMO89431.1 hypothetical protein CWC12_03775 [Pseudoalteromonas ruthenica]TMO93909.1 hypothetical protein CWC13_03700 [Pseudoalteromonas ruthenica]TMO98153.1 hypothetical protein CWC07_11430 [Pseudoalteromonas ruthenica]TMP04679.1 hypothetical protein CWC09_16025 [Pseudoalteromonas ruthenica]TMP10611.1 hypothetical protein CWC08_07880 [Pseudoalteromonas ruthenica]
MHAFAHQPHTPSCSDDSAMDGSVAGLFAHQQQKSLLKQQLTTPPIHLESDALNALVVDTTRQIITPHSFDRDAVSKQLNSLFTHFSALYEQAELTANERRQQFIHQHGLVMAPNYCIHTIKDTLRVSRYLRAIDKAVTALLDDEQGQLHIAYPACGPFAPLLVPLLSYYQSQGIDGRRLRVTFIDIQPGAIKALHHLLAQLGLQEYVHQLYCGDACQYNAPMLFDLVVVEAMQHGFSREGHLAIARHFAKQLSHTGYLIPERIDIHAMLNVAQREYVEQWQLHGLTPQEQHQLQAEVASERTELGQIMSLTADSLKAMAPQQINEQQQLIEGATLRIPHLPDKADKQTLSLYTDISLFAGETLNLYESGITHPLPDLSVCINFEPQDRHPDDTVAQSGDELKFYYCLNGLPGFLVTKVHHHD